MQELGYHKPDRLNKSRIAVRLVGVVVGHRDASGCRRSCGGRSPRRGRGTTNSPPRCAPRQHSAMTPAKRAVRAVTLVVDAAPLRLTHWSHRQDGAGERSTRPLDSFRRHLRTRARFGLQPHRSETFKLSSDPFFVEKVRDSLKVSERSKPDRARSLMSMKEPDPGAWTVPSPSCRCAPASGAATTTSATARPLSSAGPRHRHGRDHRKCFAARIGPESSQIPTDLVEANVRLLRRRPMDNYADATRPTAIRDWFANPSAALPGPSRAHQRLLAQPGRALVRAADRRNSDSGALVHRSTKELVSAPSLDYHRRLLTNK